MPEPAMKLKVDVVGAQKGVQDLNQVAAATDKNTAAANKSVGATKGAADATKGLGEALSGLGSRNNDAKDVLEGVSAAAKGGEGALFGVAKAARAAFAILSSGGIGIVVAGLALAGTAALAFANHLREPKKSAEELAKELEAAKKRAEELGKSRLQQLTSDLASIKNQANEATQALDDVLAARKRIADQEKNTALTKNRNDATITEAERTKREFAINDRFSTSDDNRSVEALAGREKIAEKVRDQEVQANAVNEREYKAALTERNELKAKISRLEELRGQLGDEYRKNPSLYDRDLGKIKAIETEAKQIGDPVSALAVNDERFQKAQDNAQKGRDAIFEAEKTLAAATKKLAAERDTQSKVSKLREEESAVTQKAAVKEATKTDIEKAQQRKTTADEQQKLAREIDAAQSAGDFGKQDELAREFKRRQKLIDLEGPAPKADKKIFTPQKFSTIAPTEKAAQDAAQDIKNTPPLDAAPIAAPVKEVSEAVKAQADQSQANVQQAGAEISALIPQVGPPLDLTPLTQQVVNLDQARGEQIAALRQQLQDATRQISQLAMSVRNSIT